VASIEDEYAARYALLAVVAEELRADIAELVQGMTDRIDQITARAKAPHDFIEKAERVTECTGEKKYPYPLEDIEDQVGVRIVVLYKDDAKKVRDLILIEYNEIEDTERRPTEPDQFSYEARHIICMIPPDIREKHSLPIDKFELQVATLFQHAWAESNHDLGYKGTLSYPEKRLLGLAAAQAWGADWIFDRLSTHDLPVIEDT